MKALLFLVLGIIVLGMVIGIVFKIIGFLIAAAIFTIIALWLWRKISGGGRGERPLS
jgi:uncharacterized membrane protein